MTTIQDLIYKRHSYGWNPGRVELDPLRCAFEITEHGRVTSWHQCTRKPVEEIEEYKFCKAHAKEVKRRLGIKQESTVRFAASFSDGEPFLARLNVIQETDKTIDIDNIETLISNGVGGIYAGRTRKDSYWMRKFRFFDDKEEAIVWLIEKAGEYADSLAEQHKNAKKVYADLIQI